jgi:PRTRC genetic system ThiF family protein
VSRPPPRLRAGDLPHVVPDYFWDHDLTIHLAGAGGNGSKMMGVLRTLVLGLRALGRRGPINVSVYDPDQVTEPNLSRQAFAPADIGQNKAEVLVNRYNLTYGFSWDAVTSVYEIPRYQHGPGFAPPHILITAVDSRASRAAIAKQIAEAAPRYWMDLGNDRSTGQVVLGEPLAKGRASRAYRLRTVTELFPEIADTTIPEDQTPSCSTIEAIERQDLYLNDLLAASAGTLLWGIFRDGIRHHGVFVNTATGAVRPLPIDRTVWKRLQRQN